MQEIQAWFRESIASQVPFSNDFDGISCGGGGGLFLESSVPHSFVVSLPSYSSTTTNESLGCTESFDSSVSSCSSSLSSRVSRKPAERVKKGGFTSFGVNWFMSVSLSFKENDDGFVQESSSRVREKNLETVVFDKDEEVDKEGKKKVVTTRPHKQTGGAMNTTNHLCSGAVAAMVSRTIVAPLERLKLEYIVLGEQKNLLELMKTIATNQGLRGFWKGNFVNILRTAPFKAINFYAYDTYRKELLKMSGNEETTNFERFLAGAASGITATLLCLPMDTIRTKMVAPGGEELAGVIDTFNHMIQTEGFLSLYKGLVPSIISMAPSGAVFYGVYDILKSSYLHSPEGRKRVQEMNEEGQELNAFNQMELGPVRTLLYGAIAGTCAEAATYPFEVVRRQLQMQSQTKKLSALATCTMIVEQRGIHALYAGLIPSLLQVLPSAAISYLVYELMKVLLKVD